MRDYHLRVGQAPARPSDIEIARVLALGIVRNDVRLVFEGNSCSGRLLGNRNVFRFPRLAAVERSPQKDAVPRGAVRPIVERSQLVERDVTDESVPLIVEGCGNISGDSVVFGIDILRHLPGMTGIP
jgi:hypothetical protein